MPSFDRHSSHSRADPLGSSLGDIASAAGNKNKNENDYESSFVLDTSKKCRGDKLHEEDDDDDTCTWTCSYTDLTSSRCTLRCCSTLSSSETTFTSSSSCLSLRSPHHGSTHRTVLQQCEDVQGMVDEHEDYHNVLGWKSEHRKYLGSLGSAQRRGPGRRNSMPSDYKSSAEGGNPRLLSPAEASHPTILEGTTDDDDHDPFHHHHHHQLLRRKQHQSNPGFGPFDDRLQRSQSVGYHNFGTPGTVSPPFTVTATSQASDASFPSIPSELSSFYQAALEEATVTEEEEEELLLKQREWLLRQENESVPREMDAAFQDDPSRSATDSCTPGDNTEISVDDIPISSFYRAALEDATLAEEEEEELLLLSKQERERERQQEQKLELELKQEQHPYPVHRLDPPEHGSSEFDAETTFGTEDIATDGAPGAFYRSALEEVAITEHELGLRDDPFLGVNDNDWHPFSSSADDGAGARSAQPVQMGTALTLRTEAERIAIGLQRGAVGKEGRVGTVTIPTEEDFIREDTHENEHEQEHEDDDDPDLRLAMYLSRCESYSTMTSSVRLEEQQDLGTPAPTCESRWTDTGDGCHASNEGEDKVSLGESANITTNTNINSHSDAVDEFMISQHKAMEEYERANHQTVEAQPQREPMPQRQRQRHDGTPYGAGGATPAASRSEGRTRRTHERRRSLLETRGATATQRAISNGNSHVVRCNGCKGRLQAPMHHSLVFCPKCQTVTPA